MERRPTLFRLVSLFAFLALFAASPGDPLGTTDGFLSATNRDALALIGGIGMLLTAIALGVAIWQMYRTTSAATAATRAAVSAFEESRIHYLRYAMSRAFSHVREAMLFARKDEWDLAGLRLSDLADLLTHVAGEENGWREIAQRLREMEESFARVGRGEIKFSQSLKAKWRKLHQELCARIAEQYGPFFSAEKESEE